MEKSVCAQCGREKKLIGQGLCCACYHRQRRNRLAHAKNPAAGREIKFTVPVDFAPMAFLLEELTKRAGAELRDISRQILWELNKSMGAGAC